MGLSVEVGSLADQLTHDPEAAQYLIEDFAAINSVLSQKRVRSHTEPTDCPVWSNDMIGYSGLHALREIAALSWKAIPIPREPEIDGTSTIHADDLFKIFLAHIAGDVDLTFIGSIVRSLLLAQPKTEMPSFAHLCVHSDSDGFYLPVDFETPVVPRKLSSETEHLWPLGSSKQLLDELNRLAVLLQISPDLSSETILSTAQTSDPTTPLWQSHPSAAHACVILREACHHSLSTGAAIHFC